MGCPHYQEEQDRRPDLHKMLKMGRALSGYAIDGGAAAHFIDGKLHKAIQFYQESHLYKVSENNGKVKEIRVKTHKL